MDRYIAHLASRLGFLRTWAWGIDLSLAGLWRLGVALVDGRLVSSHPAVHILACRWGFYPWLLSFLSVTNLGELLLSAVSTFLWLACVGPRACHSLGVAFLSISLGVYYPHLQFGSVSLRSDLGFWVSSPSALDIDFLVRVPVSLGELCWFDLSISRSLSLSIGLVNLSWIYCCCSGFC